jgi:polyhydroxyalkanoate synthesis regulator phasin
MSEGLKNAGPTFTRMTGEVFKPQISKNIQAYIDDLIVKSGERANHISDLAKIKANPDKIKAIREMEEPKTKDIQKLNGRVATLNRFISRSAE